MQLSARNQLQGRVVDLRTDGRVAEVTIELAGGRRLVSVITRAGADALALREGDTVAAVIESTDIMVAK